MNKILLFLLFVFSTIAGSTSSTLACSYAYQYSLFPLGESKQQPLFLEVELERYVNTPTSGGLPMSSFSARTKAIETRWKGYLRLKYLEANELKLIEELAYVDVSDHNYEAELLPYFKKAFSKAKAQHNFQEAILIKQALCRYDRSCNLFTLDVDTTKLQLFAQLPEYQQKQTAKFPVVVLHKFENIMQLNFGEMEKLETDAQINFYRAWKPYAARVYKVGRNKIIVYTLGWGQAKTYKGKKNDKWSDHLPPVEQFIDGKDVMMHGQRFDFIQIISD